MSTVAAIRQTPILQALPLVRTETSRTVLADLVLLDPRARVRELAFERFKATEPAAGSAAQLWYLHELTLAQGTAWGNSESTKASATMESNGIQGVMQTAGTATQDSLATAWGYTWPVTLLKDVNRTALTSPFNMNRVLTRMAVVERSVSATPAECGVVFGFCSGADVTTAQALIGCGMCWDTTTLRSTMAAKKIAGTQTVQTAGTGQATCFGSEFTPTMVGPLNSNSSIVTPLDVGFDHLTAQSNTVTQNTSNIDCSAMTHIFAAFMYTVASSVLAPTIRADFGLLIAPDLGWE